jgi:ATP-dependent DNA helicase RecQ
LKTPHEILSEYWGYGAFRPRQEDIIQTALRGEDVLALLPTGGGKSHVYAGDMFGYLTSGRPDE